MNLHLRHHKRSVVLLLSLLLILVLQALRHTVLTYQDSAQEKPLAVTASYEGIHNVRFFEGANFYNTVRRHPKSTSIASSRGILVPHHLVADDIIAQLFASVSNQKISRIVLIGPNHFELGRAPITTSLYAWSSPAGLVPPDTSFIQELMQASALIENDTAVMEEEHAHASIMPFIAYYLPNVPVVPLALSMKLSRDDMNAFIEELVAADDGTTLYVATIDFSHYLSVSEAKKRDAETRSLMLSRNIDALFTLTSQHMDSPRSLIVTMNTLEALGYPTLSIIANTTTADYIYNYTGEVTSYFGISFER